MMRSKPGTASQNSKMVWDFPGGAVVKNLPSGGFAGGSVVKNSGTVEPGSSLKLRSWF